MIQIQFQNEHLLVVDKPAGVLSVPSQWGAEDFRPVLGKMLELQMNQKIYPVHRLDFDVSGVMLFALTDWAHRKLNATFERREVDKIYQAFSQGGDFHQQQKGEWECRILRGKKRAYEKPWGQIAVTRFQVYQSYPNQIFEWRLFPITGRPHQLRYELYRHHSPILGDILYGSKFKINNGHIALRAIELSFPEELANSLKSPYRFTVNPYHLDELI